MAQTAANLGSLPDSATGDTGSSGGGLENDSPAPSARTADMNKVDGPAAGVETGPSGTTTATTEETLSDIFRANYTADVEPATECHPMEGRTPHHHHHHHHDPFLSNGSYDVDGARLFAESDDDEEEETVDGLEAVFGSGRGQSSLGMSLYDNGPCPPGGSSRDVNFGIRQETARRRDWMDSSCFFPRSVF